MIFEKDFFKLINNGALGKTVLNTRKQRYQACNTQRTNIQQKNFGDNLLAIEIKRTHILTNESIYLGLSILKISKIAMYEFWYYHAKPKYGDKMNLC